MFLTCVTSCRKSPRSNKLEEIEDIQMSPRSPRNVWRLFRLFAHYYLHLMSGIFMNNNINSGFCIITSIFRGGWTNKLWQYGGYQITFYAALILWWWSRRIEGGRNWRYHKIEVNDLSSSEPSFVLCFGENWSMHTYKFFILSVTETVSPSF